MTQIWSEEEVDRLEEMIKKERPDIWARYLVEERQNGSLVGIPSEISAVFYQYANKYFGSIPERQATELLFGRIRKRNKAIDAQSAS